MMKRVVDVIILIGKQGLALRGHRESLTNINSKKENFITVPEFLSIYDPTIRNDLEKVCQQQELEKSPELKVKGKRSKATKAKGRGSKLTFLSNRTQNNVIDVIGKEIKCAIVKQIKYSKACALIADTMPDVSHHEHCVRVVGKHSYCFEHLLCCTGASSTTVRNLYNTIFNALKPEGVTFEKLVTQTYDGAIVQDEIGNHMVYMHCYAHTLNLVLSDLASAAINVVCNLE